MNPAEATATGTITATQAKHRAANKRRHETMGKCPVSTAQCLPEMDFDPPFSSLLYPTSHYASPSHCPAAQLQTPSKGARRNLTVDFLSLGNNAALTMNHFEHTSKKRSSPQGGKSPRTLGRRVLKVNEEYD